MNNIAYLEEQLTVFEKEYQQDFFDGDYAVDFPVDISGNPYAETIEYSIVSETGGWELYSPAADDIALVNLAMETHYRKVSGWAEGAKFTDDQLSVARLAASNGTPKIAMNLEMASIKAIYNQNKEKFTEIAWSGTGDNTYGGAYGIIHQPFITVAQSYSATAWSGATDAQKLSDMYYASELMEANTFKKYKPTHLLMATDQFNSIRTKKLDTGMDTTVLEYYKKIYPNVIVDSRYQLNDVVLRVGTKDCMLAYVKDPDAIQMKVPMGITRQATERYLGRFLVWFRAKTAGIVAYKPQTIILFYGI